MSDSNLLLLGITDSSVPTLDTEPSIKPNYAGLSVSSALAEPAFKQVANAIEDQGDTQSVATTNDAPRGSQDLFLDGQSLQEIKLLDDQEFALQQVAEQFEAIFLQQMLKNMRAASSALADKDNPLTSQTDSMYQEMMDSQLALDMSKSNGIGIAEMLVKQLSTS